jgi:tetratricopeptide (TPR) repeat protein
VLRSAVQVFIVANRRNFGILALLTLLAVLGVIVYQRGFGTRLGGPPAKLQSAYATEAAWIVGEIVRDVAEMSAYPAKPGAVSASPSDAGGTYRVSAGAGAPLALDLRQDLWSPVEFSRVASVALAPGKSANSAAGAAMVPVHPALRDLTPATLIAQSASLSRALAANMLDARAHEAAALTLGGFALRESADRFNDTRWAINRMTAHLAMAIVARGDAEPGTDGELAEAVRLILTNHQTAALAVLDRLDDSTPSSEVGAWVRALRMRITVDPRPLTAPADATLLEKREYFRARRTTIAWTTARMDLDALGIDPRADWFRTIEANGVGVEDGDFLERGLLWEREEYEEAFERIHGRAIGPDAIEALNARAGRCVGAAGPQILPWGAWAEFAQRHLAMFVGKSDNHYRHRLGSTGRADTEKQRLKDELGGLSMFPIATIFWTKGVRGGDADLGLISQAIDAAVQAPERVTPAAWAFLAYGANYEAVRRGMPKPATWFMPTTPGAAYEAATRFKEAGTPRTPDLIASILKDAPYDTALATEFIKSRYRDKPPADEVRRLYGPRLEYDVRLLRQARQYAEEDDAERLRLAQQACEISSVECIALGHELANADRAYDAAVSYERAFADPALDAVALANASGWLVNYYYRHGRVDSALKLAERSAGSWQGLVTQAHLFENLGRFDEARSLYEDVHQSYDDPSQLLGFYYRGVTVRKQAELEDAWKAELARVFPDGLSPVPAGDARPARGVIVTRDNRKTRTAGLQAGDIIIGLEGRRVDNLRQYYAVNAFYGQEQMKLTVWRGKTFEVAITAPNRLMGIEFRSYPIEGWRER